MQEKRWNKEDILPEINSREYNLLLEQLETNVKFIESYKEKLKPDISIQEFMKLVNTIENIMEISVRFAHYAYLWFSEETLNQEANSFMTKIEHIMVNHSNRIMFFSLWFKDLDDKNAERIINYAPNEYKYYLKFIRITKKYTLTEKEEKIINIKDVTGTDAIFKIYEMITNAFTYKINKQELTRDELSNYVKSNNPELRKKSYQELYKVYSKEAGVLFEIYKNIILDWKNENLDLRKHKTPISVRNLSNDVSDKAVDTLLNVCRKNIKVFQDYFRLKAKICKIKKMTRYDIYTSYGKPEKNYDIKKSQELVYKAYKNYSPEMYELAKKVVDANHIDYLPRKGKITGAYAMDVGTKYLPYVLLNHSDNLRDVFTMAHELGHAVHDILSQNHSILNMQAPLVLAETASVFGEMLLFESLMKEIKDKKTKIKLIVNKLDDIYATVIRQSYFILFEIKAHELIAKGTDLNELNKAYLENLKEQFGDSIEITDGFKYEWTSIPHIYHAPFYCYAYAFGNLLVLALYDKYRKEGKQFVDKYLKILSYGGSESPSKILKEVGIDIEDEKFWQEGFDLIKEEVEELKKLIE